MKNIIFVFCLIILSACNGGGGGGSSSSSSLDCSPKTIGPTTPLQVCRSNEQVMTICSYPRDNCRRNCYSAYQSALRASGVTYSGPHMAILNQCYSGCDSSQLSCLRANGYVNNTDCGQAPVQVIDSRCYENTSNTTGGTTTGGTTTGGTTTGGTTTGETTTGGTTTGETTTGETTTGETTTGETTTGGTTTGETTTSGTTTDSSTGTWGSLSTSSAPNPRSDHSTIWTGTEMIVWGGTESYIEGTKFKTRTAISGGRYNPQTDSWITMRDSSLTSRSGYSVVWTGTEMIVWGGSQPSQQTSAGWVSGRTNTGSSYNPSTNTWNPTSLGSTARSGHTAVWTGSRMIVWGGSDIDPNLSYNPATTNTGSSYNPLNYTWSDLPHANSSNAPTPRISHSAVWTGTEMIIWGGSENGSSSCNTGGKYNPVTNTWSNVSNIGAPTSRYGHTAIWTGTEMIVWGGALGGGRYNPQTDTWANLPIEGAPSIGEVVWTGSEMVVWRGIDATGASYNPSTNTWKSLAIQNAPSTYRHTSIWTGAKMIIWGGINRSTSALENTGGQFIP